VTALSSISDSLVQSLDLELPPVALARAAAPPSGVREFQGIVPSSCAFWRRAEQEVFYASAAQHFRCPVGAMVMGFDLPDPVKDELMQLVGVMVETGYMQTSEPPRIPHLDGGAPKTGVVYGPLQRFPITPEFVLLWVTPRQAMLLTESSGSCHWTTSEPAGVAGRPACAAIPLAASRQASVLSLGCTGMRTYTEIAPERALAVIPYAALSSLAGRLTRMSAVNGVIGSFHAARKAAVPKDQQD